MKAALRTMVIVALGICAAVGLAAYVDSRAQSEKMSQEAAREASREAARVEWNNEHPEAALDMYRRALEGEGRRR